MDEAQNRGYGSEYHLCRYLTQAPTRLSDAVVKSIRQTGELIWIPPEGSKEWKGMRFLQRGQTVNESVVEKWTKFWPQRGNPPNWDAIARLDAGTRSEWLLFEAKANHAEFCSSPCGAIGPSREIIQKALGRTKAYLGVHRDFLWLGTYYQYANRIACLHFPNSIAEVPARLIFIYFTGDCFPDKRRCPETESEWHGLIEACHLTLGLPERHRLSDRIHEVFLPVLGT
ncbi:MAG: hypothetical protein WAK13_08830 [Terriglobales bacterium]